MYVEAYLQNGIHIDTLVPQNEPGYGPNGYPSMIVESWQEAELGSCSDQYLSFGKIGLDVILGRLSCNCKLVSESDQNQNS